MVVELDLRAQSLPAGALGRRTSLRPVLSLTWSRLFTYLLPGWMPRLEVMTR